jgi:ERF superfamily
MTTIYSKLLDFQRKVEAVKKTKKNPHFKNTYADINEILSEVKPLLSELNMVLSQPINDGVQYSIVTDVETGEALTSSIKLPENLQPQQLGGAITYFRRYTLVTLLSLETEEDTDGNNTTPPAPITEKWLNLTDKNGTITIEHANVIDAIRTGKISSLDQIKAVYKLSKETETQLKSYLANAK